MNTQICLLSSETKVDHVRCLREYDPVKTMIDLPDVTFRQAKVAAAAYGMTLEQFFAEALEERLRRRGLGSGTDGVEPPWMAGLGELSDLADENRHVLKIIEEEFERLSPEDLP